MKKTTEETSIKQGIKKWLKLKGWFVFHNLAGLGCYPGLSDFTAVKDGKVLFIEVKTPKGKQSDNQMQFDIDISTAGGYYLVARGHEDIEEFLERI